MNISHKSKERIRDLGEVFTNKREVDAMLDLAGNDILDPKRRILEPACGNGNFLVEILIRRMDYLASKSYATRPVYERNVLTAISNIYGIDIMADNVDECRHRLYAETLSQYSLTRNTENYGPSFLAALREILQTNIILGDSLNTKQDINFIEYTITPKGTVKRRQFNLLEMERGSDAPVKVFNDTTLDDMQKAEPEKVSYLLGDQIDLFPDTAFGTAA